MDARQARERLAEIRYMFKTRQIEADEAYKLAEEPLKTYNDKAKEIAKKYGVRAKTLPNKIIYW